MVRWQFVEGEIKVIAASEKRASYLEQMTARKLLELEATRGAAAIVVLVHHLLLAFFPRLHGLLLPDERASLFGTPFFALVNGSAAVVLFFVLSGFVLTIRAFHGQSFVPLVVGALKRWPRLLAPVLIVNLGSGVLAGWAFYQNQAIAQEIGSPWLGVFFGGPTDQWRTLLASAEEGAVSSFVQGDAYFNSNLWTMYYEFFGSYLAFAVASAMLFFARGAALVLAAVMIAAALLLSPYFMCFLIGVGLAAFHSSATWNTYSSWAGRRSRMFWLAATGLIFVILGYHEALAPTRAPIGLYRALEPLYRFSPLGTRVFLHAIGSAAVLLIVLALPGPKLWLAGRFGALLGSLSFPIYLLQVPVICFVGATIYVWCRSPIAALVGSAGVTVLVAIPLMWVEALWLTVIQAIAGKTTRDQKTGYSLGTDSSTSHVDKDD